MSFYTTLDGRPHTALGMFAQRGGNTPKPRKQGFVVALFTEFMAPIDTREVDHVVNELHGGLFSDYPQVSGLIHFEYSSGAYCFSGIANASAAIQSDIVECFR